MGGGARVLNRFGIQAQA